MPIKPSRDLLAHEPELLNGIREIAAFFRWSPRRVTYLLSTQRLPCVFRLGNRVHMTPATGRAWLASQSSTKVTGGGGDAEAA